MQQMEKNTGLWRLLSWSGLVIWLVFIAIAVIRYNTRKDEPLDAPQTSALTLQELRELSPLYEPLVLARTDGSDERDSASSIPDASIGNSGGVEEVESPFYLNFDSDYYEPSLENFKSLVGSALDFSDSMSAVEALRYVEDAATPEELEQFAAEIDALRFETALKDGVQVTDLFPTPSEPDLHSAWKQVEGGKYRYYQEIRAAAGAVFSWQDMTGDDWADVDRFVRERKLDRSIASLFSQLGTLREVWKGQTLEEQSLVERDLTKALERIRVETLHGIWSDIDYIVGGEGVFFRLWLRNLETREQS